MDLVGKGGHRRTVPIPNWVKEAADRWMIAARVSAGRIFRAVSRHGTPWRKGISENVVWYALSTMPEETTLPLILALGFFVLFLALAFKWMWVALAAILFSLAIEAVWMWPKYDPRVV